MRSKTTIIDLLKKEAKRPLNVTNPVKVGSGGGNVLDFYQYTPAEVEKAVEVAVQEIEKEQIQAEVIPEPEVVGEIVEEVIVETPPQENLKPLIEELKSVLVEGFDKMRPDGDSIVLQETMLEHIRALKSLPAPQVEVNMPDQPKIKPIKKVKAGNIVRDMNGNISSADFEVER